MNIVYNKTFKQFLTEFNISENLDIDIVLPKDVNEIINQEIVLDNDTIYFKTSLKTISDDYTDIYCCYDEKSHNHFHVDWFVKPMNTRDCFKLWVKTILLLAEKMESLWFSWIVLTYSFHSAELQKMHDESMWFNAEWEKYYIWDELSFYKNRWNDNIMFYDNFETKYWALMTINI